MGEPEAYFITFATYGTWLHGNKKLSVDPNRNQIDTPRIPFDKAFLKSMKNQRNFSEFYMSSSERRVVLSSILNTCKFHDYLLYAAHIRTNHVHVLIKPSVPPNIIMGQLKSYASRALNEYYGQKRKYWARHGSTRYIWKRSFILPVMRYIIEDQGEKMECFYQDWYEDEW